MPRLNFMTLLARIFPLLLLSISLLAQDVTEPSKTPALNEQAAEILSEPKLTDADQPNTDLTEPAESDIPKWDPVTDPPKEKRRPRRNQKWNQPNNGTVVWGQKTVVAPGEKISDLVLFGGTADIQGEVEHDVVAIGGSVNISGKVGGDVVVIGGKGTFSGHVHGDSVVIAGRADVTKTARLDHDAVFFGGPFKI
jgi:hypothetical protein